MGQYMAIKWRPPRIDCVYHLLYLYSGDDVTIDCAAHYGARQLWGDNVKIDI